MAKKKAEKNVTKNDNIELIPVEDVNASGEVEIAVDAALEHSEEDVVLVAGVKEDGSMEIVNIDTDKLTNEEIIKHIQDVLSAPTSASFISNERVRILKDFSLRVPIQGHRNAASIISFRAGNVISDAYIIQYLKTTSKPVEYFFE